MSEFVKFIYPAYPVIALLGGLFYFYGILRFLWYLKHNHEDVWISLGTPSFPLNYSFGNQIAIFKFLHKREYKKCNDLKFTRICHLFLLAFWGLVTVFIFMSLSMQWVPRGGY